MARTRSITALGIAAALSLHCTPTPELRAPQPDAATLEQNKWDVGIAGMNAYADRKLRLRTIAYAIRAANADACRDENAALLGLVLQRGLGFGSRELRNYAIAAWNLGRFLTVVRIVPGTPVANSDLRLGDVLRRVNGKRVDDERELHRALRAAPIGELVLGMERDHRPLEVRLAAERGCMHNVGLSGGDFATTYTLPGKWIGVTDGLMRTVHSDDELAVMIAHQMAHHLLLEYDEPTDDQISVDFGDGWTEDIEDPYREFETDRLGLHMAARAGYDVRGAPGLWRRIAVEHPWKIEFFRSWPSGTHLTQELPHGQIPRRLPRIRAEIEKILATRQLDRQLEIAIPPPSD